MEEIGSMPMKQSTTFLVDNLGTSRRARIVDVGANPLNSPPYAMLLKQGACDVIGFEPDHSAFEELKKYESEHATFFPYALGDEEEVQFNLYRSSGLNSVFAPYEGAFTYLGRSRKNMTLIESKSMKTKKLDNIKEVPQFDLLKIDIQGGEVKVFQGARKKLSNALVVITEVRFYQLYENEPMFGGVDTELRKQGFQLLKINAIKSRIVPNSQQYSINRPIIRSQWIDGDAIYIRDLGKLDNYSDDQLRHLSLLACGVFESYDVTLFCLDELVKRGALGASIPEDFVNTFPAKMRETPEHRKAARLAARNG